MKYKFEFTEEQANLILAALQELPYKMSNAIILEIQNQAQEQLKPKNEEPDIITDSV